MNYTPKIIIALMLTILFVGGPSFADNAAGEAAYAKGNYAVALDQFTKAANAGDINAQYNLGLMYEHGYGVKQSDIKASEWYQKAADNGHPDAPMALQLLYEYF